MAERMYLYFKARPENDFYLANYACPRNPSEGAAYDLIFDTVQWIWRELKTNHDGCTSDYNVIWSFLEDIKNCLHYDEELYNKTEKKDIIYWRNTYQGLIKELQLATLCKEQVSLSIS